MARLTTTTLMMIWMTIAMARSKRRRQDPTGQARRRNSATRALNARLTVAEREVKRLFREVPRRRRSIMPIANQGENEPTAFFEYDLSPAALLFFEAEIRLILDEALETIDNIPPPGWFWADKIEPPYREGTVREVARFNQLLSAAIARRAIVDPFIQVIPIEGVLQSPEYLTDLRQVIAKNYKTIKSLSNTTASQVIQEINSGIAAGLPPSDISKNITKRFDVSKSSAKRIADTEVNRAFNDGKMDQVERAAKRTGLRAGVIHISALLPTTRDEHARRHGLAFTVEDQRQWWDSGSNRINCKCSTVSVLIDSAGNVVQSQEQDEIRAERKFFDRD